MLVSAETVKDFQLLPGDTINLRLQDARTHQLTTVGFHYIGVVTEFPTAPKDSFFVANAGYVAQHTGSDAVGAFLVDTGGRDTTAVAARIQTAVGTTATVTDIATTRGTVGSSLTAVNLAGLTRIELGFGLVLAAASGALVLALGLTERRRSFVIAHALGATRRHLRSFVLAETAILVACGLTAGAILGAALSQMLVRVLTGVFDPPPTALSTPWIYLAAIAAGDRCDQRGVGRHGSPCATLSADGAGRAVVLTAPGWAPTKQSDVGQQPGSVISFSHPDTCHSSTRHRTEWYCARVRASVCSTQIGAPHHGPGGARRLRRSMEVYAARVYVAEDEGG